MCFVTYYDRRPFAFDPEHQWRCNAMYRISDVRRNWFPPIANRFTPVDFSFVAHVSIRVWHVTHELTQCQVALFQCIGKSAKHLVDVKVRVPDNTI